MATINNALTDVDREQVATYLRENGYDSLEEWALDSDYRQNEVSTEWHNLADPMPFADPVDIEVACFQAIEAAGEAQDERRYGFF